MQQTTWAHELAGAQNVAGMAFDEIGAICGSTYQTPECRIVIQAMIDGAASQSPLASCVATSWTRLQLAMGQALTANWASLAIVFMLRAVPFLAAGILSLERPKPRG
jgi:hypothetical protein